MWNTCEIWKIIISMLFWKAYELCTLLSCQPVSVSVCCWNTNRAWRFGFSFRLRNEDGVMILKPTSERTFFSFYTDRTYCQRAGGLWGWAWCPLSLWSTQMSSVRQSDLEASQRRQVTSLHHSPPGNTETAVQARGQYTFHPIMRLVL